MTPLPKQMSVQTGTFVFPATFAVGGDGLDKSVRAEVRKFVSNFNRVTGSTATAADRAAGTVVTLRQVKDATNTYGQEGYRLTVQPEGVTIEAATATGFFYAFASLNKMLPACVAAGVHDAAVTRYELPCLTITDGPRFAYRGFMLDVARHFFTVDEIKRMLDLMAVYKLNKFHFHLTEDQGWRWEVKKYPRLTSVGSVASNTYVTSMQHGAYWTNRPYGPYFYTRAELKDIVAYAAERHIEVIPEIDMPGHFSAAMAAYPQFSCNPSGPHRVETWGGVFTDVLNVADPKAVRFVKDILDELMDIFPSENIHIGGDECPTTAWENNKQCQEMYKRLKLTSYRQLQTHFIDEISTYLRSKGRKISVWNETVTEKGADLQLMKKTGATVYCWVPARRGAEIANELGLP
ncbi:MAG: beta-N-acetylhexosaminidase, partial [Prevotellaceae bacterium]|nr:beta-N-acetylhexosaminidase [Prevotellaceae bacterium]